LQNSCKHSAAYLQPKLVDKPLAVLIVSL